MNAPALTLVQLLWALGIASAFVLWPILGKFSQASGAWINALVIIGTAFSGIGLSYPVMKGQPIPSVHALGWLIVAGVINGAAVYFYATKAVEVGVPTGVFIMTVIILMVVMTPVFNYLLNGEILSVRQWAGLGAALLAIFLLAG